MTEKKIRLSFDAITTVDVIFETYIAGLVNDGDAARAKREVLDVMRAEVARQVREDAAGVAAAPPRCDHKFVDSTVCLKCGWKPAGPSPQEAR